MAGGRRIVPVEGVGTGASGRACLYVLPCAYEDHAKLGIATDPIARMQAFSPRYYAFFDLDRGWLAEAGSLREARAWETHWKRTLRPHAAPPPLAVPAHAAGRTEWFRGADATLQQARATLEAGGFVVHPLRPWIAQRLRAQRPQAQHRGQPQPGDGGLAHAARAAVQASWPAWRSRQAGQWPQPWPQAWRWPRSPR